MVRIKPRGWRHFAIPDHMKEGLDRYICLGIRPGSFLYFVLCNDFSQAVVHADEINSHKLREYGLLLHSGLIPNDAWGSEKTVEAWIARRGESANVQERT